ncbi:MAG: PHP domain-containing protein [bacterium]|nr:PHP domain-containing protein [bacterium]
MHRCDLHTHTTKSDGLYSPRELVYLLYSKGIKIFSITDHDSVEALAEAQEEALKLNIELIPGVELSAEYKGEEVHVLGYFIDLNSEYLISYLETFRKARKERFWKMVEKLKGLGIEINPDISKFEENKAIGRPHIARELLERGFVSSIEEAFEKYIGDSGPAYVKKFKISVEEAIDIIHKSGGIAILAHPGIINRMDEVIDISILKEIDGIEVFHPKNPCYLEDKLKEIAFKNGLLITGGTDFHGDLEGQGYPVDFNLYCDVSGRRIDVVRR